MKNEQLSPRCFDPQPVTLQGRYVRVEPLSMAHAPDLHTVAGEESIWRYLPTPTPTRLDGVRAWIEAAIDASRELGDIPFATIYLLEDRAVGSTRFLEISREDRSLEIGWTWVGVDYQRTAVNTECKYLLLKHAFEDLDAVRVQFKTDSRNESSQRAIERIGGVREGVLRKHRQLWNGVGRDSVYYSIIDDEWPDVRQQLEEFLERRRRRRSGAPAPSPVANS